MKFCTFRDTHGNMKVGVQKRDTGIVELTDYRDMKDLINSYDRDIKKIEKIIEKGSAVYKDNDIQFMAPVLNPDKIIFIGLNYRDHAREINTPIPEFPILFSKYRNSLIGSGENIVIPDETKKCDYEAEFAFIIGRTARNINVEDAMRYVFGYTICNDVSARDLQGQTSQWLIGKAVDTFAPMGPFAVTTDEIDNPHNLNITCKINGTLRQKSNTKELIFNIPFLLSFLSRTITLEPGDIISTGTPAGVIIGMKEQVWMKDGDICEIEIEGIGILRNKFFIRGDR